MSREGRNEAPGLVPGVVHFFFWIFWRRHLNGAILGPFWGSKKPKPREGP